ncbi:LOW QUALITY PROTEIN: translocon-associated protein subunit alpha-like [Brachionichthys hirsutus]|uniref:LOW QUALITY PROTEIN: translocon-associated protein subunit alpha-like n=1 Tax=Brachionichthys hirsutus TaxID=412623 RepID=UPI0036044375
MLRSGSKLLLLFLLTFRCGLVAIDPDSAEDADAAVDEEEEDDEDELLVEEDQIQPTEGDEDDKMLTSHPEADTTIIFLTGEEFPANEIVRLLVGFTNKGSEDFTVRSLEASFRYPQDFQFYIQNFTASPLNTRVQPEAQASFDYSFIPAQPMAGRPFGLVILLNYLDAEGSMFQAAVYNQTVTVTERDEGLDGETMFMYIFLAGLLVLMLFGMYQLLETRTKKRLPVKIEKGTGGVNDVDISWIPQETLNVMNKASPKASPRKRANRAAGVDQ